MTLSHRQAQSNQPSHDIPSRDLLCHPPDQDSTGASPRQPKKRTTWWWGVGGWAEVAKERDQEKEEQRQVEEPPTLSSCLSRLPARPALLNCWDQKRSDG